METAISWLKANGNRKIGIAGASTTGTLALTAAAMFPDITLTIAMTPSDFVWQGFLQGKRDGCKEWPVEGESLFSYRGKPLPYMPFCYQHPDYWHCIAAESKRTGDMVNSRKLFDDSETAHPIEPEEYIPVENIRGKLLLIGAEDDALWDTAKYIRRMDRLFDGVGIMLLRLEMETYTEIRTQIGMIEINFCINGRFETSFSMRDSVLLKPGDMAVSCYDGRHGTRSESRFPLGCYEGLCLEVDPAAAQNWLEKNAPGFSVDFAVLKQNLLGNRWFMFGTAGPRCEHVFRELYENAPYMDLRFLRLKVVELLMLLSRIPQEEGTDLYCSTEQTELAHHLRDHLLTNREGYVSLAQLAEEHGISVSHLQKMFKQVYGVPVYHYIKEYRLEQAAVELVRSAKPITQIAQNAGYDNASKFSEAFRKRYGTTPSQYRTHANGLAKRSRKIRME